MGNGDNLCSALPGVCHDRIWIRAVTFVFFLSFLFLKDSSGTWIFVCNLLFFNVGSEYILFKNYCPDQQNTSMGCVWLWATSMWSQIYCSDLQLECGLTQIRFPEMGLHFSNALLNVLMSPPPLFPISVAGLFYEKSISSHSHGLTTFAFTG